MSIESDIYGAITDSAPIAALIGDRFFWEVADGDAAPPYVVGQMISSDGETDMDGNREIVRPQFQFSAWAVTKAEAVNIAATFRQELEGVAIPGESDVSLHYAGEQSSRDPETRLFGSILELRAVAIPNSPT